jgi:hypothetical protein
VKEVVSVYQGNTPLTTLLDTPFFNSSLVMDVLTLRFNKVNYQSTYSYLLNEALEVQKPVLNAISFVKDLVGINPLLTFIDEAKFATLHVSAMFSMNTLSTVLYSTSQKLTTLAQLTFSVDVNLFTSTFSR